MSDDLIEIAKADHLARIDRHNLILENERLKAVLEAIANGAPYGYKAAAYEEIARAALSSSTEKK
jgi:ABC-type enterobactin transport system permease subunit